VKESKIDRYLANNLGRLTHAELAKESSIPEGDVERRAQAYYDAILISAPRRRAKLFMQMEDIAIEAMDRARNSSARESSGNFNSAIAAIKAINKELADAEKRESESDQKEMYGRIFAQMIQSGLDRAIGVLQARHPELDSKELQKELQAQIMEISAEMDED
jgi:hypothetical protein